MTRRPSDGGLLYLAVEHAYVDGVPLEGEGAPPDVVGPDAFAYAAGRDAQLERALDVAADLAARAG